MGTPSGVLIQIKRSLDRGKQGLPDGRQTSKKKGQMMRHQFYVMAALAIAVSALQGSAPAVAGDGTGSWQIRLRGIDVVPSEDANVNPIGGNIAIDDAIVPELDITYFFTDHVAVELILATTKHDVMVVDTALGDVDLGSVRLLPPTLTLQYHFEPVNRIKPYLGAGVNYTLFYDEEDGAVPNIDYDPSFGIVLQAGIDIDVGEGWLINLDVKKVLMDTDVTLAGGAITADVDIDPWIFGVGFGYRF